MNPDHVWPILKLVAALVVLVLAGQQWNLRLSLDQREELLVLMLGALALYFLLP